MLSQIVRHHCWQTSVAAIAAHRLFALDLA
jgi:hypothetical protein